MINRTTQVLSSEVPRRLAATEKAVRDMKNRQNIGSDSLKILNTPIFSLAGQTIPAGGTFSFVVNWNYLSNPSYFLSEMGYDPYIDSYDINHLWSTGSSITGGLLNCQITLRFSPALSDMTGTGKKAYVLTLKNEDTVSHIFYVDLFLLYPTQG